MITKLIKDAPLKHLNTFKFNVKAKYLTEVKSLDNLKALLNHPLYASLPHIFLGGGSNTLFTGDFPGIVAHLTFKGIEIINEDNDNITVKAQAGENWEEFVNYCVDKGWSGIENLALIPGNVGSCPIQNIGAYGSEVKDTIEYVEVIDLKTKEIRNIPNANCNFGYRSSIFKKELKDKVVITAVAFRLSKKPNINTNYIDVQKELEASGITKPTPRDIADAVIAIRQRKLPDLSVHGNAGSFFKNPYISIEKFNKLKADYPEIPSYPIDANSVKVPAGWLIEKCSWKGYHKGDAGVHERQALVLINKGHATGQEIVNLAKEIINSVREKFGIELEMEVNVV